MVKQLYLLNNLNFLKSSHTHILKQLNFNNMEVKRFFFLILTLEYLLKCYQQCQLFVITCVIQNIILQQTDIAIVKNIPENNARLWTIKHLIKVTPIVFPYGEPTEKDLHATFLKENGECIVHKDITITEKQVQITENFKNDQKKLDSDTLKKDSRLKWLNPWN